MPPRSQRCFRDVVLESVEHVVAQASGPKKNRPLAQNFCYSYSPRSGTTTGAYDTRKPQEQKISTAAPFFLGCIYVKIDRRSYRERLTFSPVKTERSNTAARDDKKAQQNSFVHRTLISCLVGVFMPICENHNYSKQSWGEALTFAARGVTPKPTTRMTCTCSIAWCMYCFLTLV